ncbi:MAG: glycosyltransferase [Patescibacteria group bacterium]
MNIFYLITRADQGGAQTKVLALAKAGLERGHQVRIGTGESGWLTERAKEAGIPVVVFRHLQRTWNPLAVGSFLRELKKEIVQHPIDILHLHSSNTLFGALLRGRLGVASPKIIATVCGLSIMNPGWTGNRLKKMLFNLVTAKLWARCDWIIFVCHWDREFAVRQGFVRAAVSSVVYNGLPENVPYLSRTEARRRLDIDMFGQEFVVGTVARLDYQKGLDLFIDLADVMRHENIKFRIVGTGADLMALEQRIADLGLRDQVTILTESKDAFRFMPAFDVFVLTSRYEGLPWTLLEAQQARVPMVSVDVAGCSEIVLRNQTGWLIADRRPEALAAAIREVRERPDLAVRLTENAYRRGRTVFAEAALTDGNYSIYNKLLSDA